VYTAGVLTVSDSAARGDRRDESGPVIRHLLEQHGYNVLLHKTVPDDVRDIKDILIKWIDNTSFPKVFKRSSGAGSHSVKLIKNKKEARSYIRRAFGRGFLAIDRYAVLQNRIWHFKRDKTLKSFFNISRGIYRYVFPHHKNLNLPILISGKDYYIFQDNLKHLK